MKDVTRAHCIDWSPDGRTLGLVTDDEETIGSQHGIYSLIIIDPFAQNAEPRKLFDTREGNDFIRYSALSWSPTGNTLATLTHPEARDRPQGIALWQADKEQDSVKFFENPQPETMMDLPPEKLPANPETLRNLNYDRKRHCLCWTSNGTKILVQDNLLNIRIWDVQTSTSQQSIRLPDRSNAISMGKRPDVPVQMYLPTVIPSPTDPALFATNDLDIIVIANANQRSVQRLLIGNDVQELSGMAIANDRYYPQVSALAWSPNGRYIAGAYMSSPQIFVWDLQDPQPHRDKDGLQLPTLSFGKTDGQDSVLTALAWSPDGRYLASSSFDTTVIIWQVDKG
jgi:WD40 repeat protein